MNYKTFEIRLTSGTNTVHFTQPCLFPHCSCLSSASPPQLPVEAAEVTCRRTPPVLENTAGPDDCPVQCGVLCCSLFYCRFPVSVSDPGLGELTRSFLLHLPAGYETSNSVSVPLVVDFHCRTCSATTQMNSAWPQVADQDQEGFVYVAMEGEKSSE